MAGYVDWHPEAFRAAQAERLRKAADRAGREGVRLARRAISARGSASRRSAPGQAPFYQTGTLSRSLDHRVGVGPDAIAAHVGTPLIVARFLERGTGRMRPRPFLSRLLVADRDELRAILLRGR